jgi:hypothetical protein
MICRIVQFALLCLASGGFAFAAAVDVQRPSRPAMIFDVTPGPAAEAPATQPSTRPARPSALRIPDAPLPLVGVRKSAVALDEQRPPLTIVRQPAEPPLLLTEADPPRPGLPPMRANGRYSAPTVYEPWFPPQPLVRLRVESPVRANEPVLDPMGGSKLEVLPIFRSTAVAAPQTAIPDPLENVIDVQLPDPPADDDPPAALPALAAPTLSPEKITLPVPPATRPAKAPATQPAK